MTGNDYDTTPAGAFVFHCEYHATKDNVPSPNGRIRERTLLPQDIHRF